jgi:CubicO group peptidase (beta-lactamase class C family)
LALAAPPENPALVQAQVTPAVSPENLQRALGELEALTEKLLQQTQVPGLAIAVVYRDQVVYLKGFGVREVGKLDPITPDTVFQLASLSKPLTSTILAGVVGRTPITWDDPVVNHDPDFALDVPYVTTHVTLRDLLSHRSGLPDHAGDSLEDLGFDQKTVLRQLRYLPTQNHFRAQYAYTNFAFSAAAIAVAKTQGMDWETLAEEGLFAPLAMAQSSFRYADFVNAPNRAKPHIQDQGKWQVPAQPRNPDAQAPAGGASASVRDLAQWLRLQLAQGKIDGQQLIAAEALAETHRPQMVSDRPENADQDLAHFYGLGWGVNYRNGRVQLSHSGAFNLGAATAVYLLPQTEVGIVVLSNSAPIGVPESLAISFLDLVEFGQVRQDYFPKINRDFARLFASPYPSPDLSTPRIEPSAKQVSHLIGDYQNQFFGPLQIRWEEGQLVLRMGPRLSPYPLTAYQNGRFSYQPQGENAYGPSWIDFTLDAAGQPLAVTLDNLKGEGQGQFTRIP